MVALAAAGQADVRAGGVIRQLDNNRGFLCRGCSGRFGCGRFGCVCSEFAVEAFLHPAVVLICRPGSLAQQFSRELYEEGVFGMAIGFPTVPQGKARIRVMISAAHDNDDLGKGLDAFAKVGKRLSVIK
jgi:hypothetical protein